MSRVVKRIRARGDDRKIYDILEWFTETTATFDGKVQRLGTGTTEWKLTDGRGVNRIDPETFKIIRTNMIVRKIS